MSAIAADLDADDDVDIYVATDSTAAILYRNNGNGTFADVALESGAAYNALGAPQAGMGLGVADVNADGRLDLVKTHFADDIPALYRALGRGLFEDVALSAGLAAENRFVQWGVGLPDLDNDGWQTCCMSPATSIPRSRPDCRSTRIAPRGSSIAIAAMAASSR